VLAPHVQLLRWQHPGCLLVVLLVVLLVLLLPWMQLVSWVVQHIQW
jgi:hypothetical protein